MKLQPLLFSLEYLPLLIRLECKEAASLPPFLGSTLHGVLGWELAKHPALYAYLFENKRFGGAGQDIVNPYMIEPPRSKAHYQPGESLCFKLVLFGDAAGLAEEVVQVLARLRQFRIGAARCLFEPRDILHGEQYGPIWQEGVFRREALVVENIAAVSTQELASWCSVHLVTPLRIRRGGALVQKMDFPTIIRSITKRISLLVERYGGAVDAAAASGACELASEIRMASHALYLNQMHRYSNRRQESLDWSGMLGAMTFEGKLTAFTPWLHAARILHIGRNSTFGCGQLDIVCRYM
ncbi:hypothetical protein DQG13_24205 [Paenibacillus sp. YN15]|nr:hypothetical protein DQG13_24205 [Paenibacillus sp. YN15]